MFTPVAIFTSRALAGVDYTLASGGTVTTDGDYKIHTFTTNGTFNISKVGTLDPTFEVLVVGGGGGGGARAGGGGGGGGLIYIPSSSAWTGLSAGSYSITIGAGGAGGRNALGDRGDNGGNSTLGSVLTAVGGGAGGGFPSYPGQGDGNNGGSGGGGQSYSGTTTATETQTLQSGDSGTYGYGGDGAPFYSSGGAGGGGGGAGGVQPTGPRTTGGAAEGADGKEVSITGTPTYYAGGGGGAGDCASGYPGSGGLGGGGNGATCYAVGTAATANTGGGGGGGGGSFKDGGAGGSGIVIIRYRYQTTAFTGLLDDYPGAYAAYSVRKLRSGYTGNALQVIKTDNSTTQDIGFDANGNLDTAAITSFLAGGTGYISVWYDQSGNGYDLTRGYGTAQAYYGPRIANSGVIDTLNGYPALYFDNISNVSRVELKNTSVSFTEDTFSTYTVSYTPNGASSSNYTKYGRMISVRGPAQDYENNTGWTTFVSTPTGLDGLYLYHASAGVRPATFTTVDDTQLLVSALRNGTSANIKYNGGSATSATWAADNLAANTLGVGNNGAYNDSGHQGYIQEVIYYKTNQSSNDSNIIDNINTYFSVY